MYDTKLLPRESGAYISKYAKSVTVLEENIPEAATMIFGKIQEKQYSIKTWKQWPLHPQKMTKEAVDWIFVVDCLNFSFWLPTVKQFQVEYQGKQYEDYQALCACINRALEEGIPITTPSYYRNITLQEMQHVFRSCNDTQLPLLEQRLNNLIEAGTVICEQYSGSFSDVIEEGNKSAKKMIEVVTNNFSSFRDEKIFRKTRVCFYKRVQILVADIWACFEGCGYGEFNDISELTMFADYRVPQALLALKTLEYSEELRKMIADGYVLPSGSVEEMEIRGCSIHVVELLRNALNVLLQDDNSKMVMNSVIIDFYLWDYATENIEEMKGYPEHRTRSIFY